MTNTLQVFKHEGLDGYILSPSDSLEVHRTEFLDPRKYKRVGTIPASTEGVRKFADDIAGVLDSINKKGYHLVLPQVYRRINDL